VLFRSIPGRAGLSVYDHWCLLNDHKSRMHFVQGLLAGAKVAVLPHAAPKIKGAYVRDAGDALNTSHAELCIEFEGNLTYQVLTLLPRRQALWTKLFIKNIFSALPDHGGASWLD